MTANDNVLPDFDSNGNLPPGDYWPVEADFEHRFVRVGSSTTRVAIYEGFKRHRVELISAGVDGAADCLLDGSYMTSKLDPGDIDLAVEVDAATFLNSPRVQQLLAGPDCKDEFSCDAYPVLVFPPNDPNYGLVTEKFRAYWRKWFGTDRNGSPKGRVWTKAAGFR